MLALPRRRVDPTESAVRWLLGGQLVMFTGIAAIFPVAALYVRHRGGDSLAIGLFIAGPMILNTLVQVPAGHLADRIGRRPMLLGARLGYALLAFALFADQGPLWLLALFRAAQGACGGAYVPALRAVLADLTPPDRRAQRYSQLQAAEMVGLLVGPAIGGAVAVWRDNGIFLCSGVAILLATLATTRVPETRGTIAEHAVPAPPGWWRHRGILVPCIGLGALGLVFTMYDVVWPQYLDARGNGTFVIGLSITLFAVPMLVLARPGGRPADRADRRLVLGVCMAVVAGCAVTYPELRSLGVILAVGTVEACGIVMVEPSLYAVISEQAPGSVRGRAMGIGGFVQFAGAAIGAGVLGSLYGVAEGLPFWIAGGALLAAAGVAALLLPARPPASADGAEAGVAVLDAVEDGDDVGRAQVDRPLLAGELDEAVGPRGELERRHGVLDPELDGDVTAVGETQHRHGVASAERGHEPARGGWGRRAVPDGDPGGRAPRSDDPEHR